MSIRPIGKRVLILEKKADERRASGLIIPGPSSDKKVKYGRIEAVGSTVDEVRKGDTIIFDGNRGREIEDQGEKYLLLEIDEVLAVVEEEK